MVNMQHEPNLWQGYQDVMNSRPSSKYQCPFKSFYLMIHSESFRLVT